MEDNDGTNTDRDRGSFSSGNPGNARRLTDVESFMVRRFICDYTPKNYNRFFLSVLSKAKKAHLQKQSILEAVRKELTKSSLDTNVWPDNKRFQRGWLSKALYVKSRSDRSAMVLKALQAKMKTNKNEALQLIEALSVEHLLPQGAKLSDYPYPDVELEEGYSAEEYRLDMIHTVGNSTLLTGPLNSSVSNGEFSRKVDAICDDSDLRLNAWLRKSAPSQWDEIQIEKRAKKLFNLAVEIWPEPKAD